MRNGMRREAIASVLSSVLIWAPILFVLFYPPDLDPNDSWQRGMVLVPFEFGVTVSIVWLSGRYLLSRGIHTAVRFVLGACALTLVLVAIFALPAIIVGSAVGFSNWTTSIAVGTAAALSASAASIPASLVWWWIVAHNQRFKPTKRASGAPAGLS